LVFIIFVLFSIIYEVEEDDLREEISSILTILQSSSSQTTSSQSHQQDFGITNQSRTSGGFISSLLFK